MIENKQLVVAHIEVSAIKLALNIVTTTHIYLLPIYHTRVKMKYCVFSVSEIKKEKTDQVGLSLQVLLSLLLVIKCTAALTTDDFYQVTGPPNQVVNVSCYHNN